MAGGGSRTVARRGLDVARDPRVTLHSPITNAVDPAVQQMPHGGVTEGGPSGHGGRLLVHDRERLASVTAHAVSDDRC
jgi:hypothetical protein